MSAAAGDELLLAAREAVNAVERAWGAGRAASALDDESTAAALGDPLTASYRRAIELDRRPPFRDALLAQIWGEMERRQLSPAFTFAATGVCRPDPSSDAAPLEPSAAEGAPGPARAPLLTELRVDFAGAPTTVRVDQALAARHWRVWYACEDVAQQDALWRAWVNAQRVWLAGAIAFVNRLQRDFVAERLTMFPDGVGRDFEQLVLDVLNEHERVARHAALDEDLFEKTDLRVRLPDLDRKRGARVQVTLVTDPSLLDEKLTKVPHRDEVVVVSPLTLAMDAWGRAGTRAFPRTDAAAFFDAVGSTASTPERLAQELKATFLRAMAAPATPRGPAMNVPAPLRTFVRRYVESSARQTTSQLRARQASGERTVPRSTPVKRRGRTS